VDFAARHRGYLEQTGTIWVFFDCSLTCGFWLSCRAALKGGGGTSIVSGDANGHFKGLRQWLSNFINNIDCGSQRLRDIRR
jgi:hypothetical protein